MFLTSHILEIVERLCDHIGIIHKGTLVAQGPMAELRGAARAGTTLEERFLELVGAERAHRPTLDWLGGMMRFLRAFVWLRWRLHGQQHARRRSGATRWSVCRARSRWSAPRCSWSR